MATQTQTTSRVNGALPKRQSIPNGPAKAVNGTTPRRVAPTPQQKTAPVQRKAASVAGESPVGGMTSAYSIMATRLANRVAELAEGITFVEKPKPHEPEFVDEPRKRPRKLEMRLQQSPADQIAFSAPFLDNTLQKMLTLQNRMLKSTADITKAKGGSVDESIIKELAGQSAELSRIIALICAEKARQNA